MQRPIRLCATVQPLCQTPPEVAIKLLSEIVIEDFLGLVVFLLGALKDETSALDLYLASQGTTGLLYLLESVYVLDLHVFLVQAALSFQCLQGMVQREDRFLFSVQLYSSKSLRGLSFGAGQVVLFDGQTCTRFYFASFPSPAFELTLADIWRGDSSGSRHRQQFYTKIYVSPGSENHRRLSETGMETVDLRRYNFKPIIEAGLYSIIDQPYSSHFNKYHRLPHLHAYGSAFAIITILFMFSKIAQLRSFIAHAITSLQSQRPQLPTDDALPGKLAFMTDHIMKAALPLQFKAYHELQAPEINLNQLLSQIYHAEGISTEQVTAILHFYTFLLLNCQNQLVLCKIVSDSFVLELTQIYPNCLHQLGQSPYVDLQEINSYKIALVKAYVSRLQPQTAKYMVVGDRMRIFESCVRFCTSFQGKKQWGVEITCMSNCVLLITKFIAENEEYYSFCFQENGMSSLLTHLVSLIHESVRDMLTISESFEEELESLRSAILFTVDLISHVTENQYRTTLIEKTFQKLADLRELFWQLVDHYTVKNDQETDYMKILELIKVLLKLLAIYFKVDELAGLFQRSLLPILDKFIISFGLGLKKIKIDKGNKQELGKLLHLFCSVTQILALILQEGGYLSRRKTASSQQKQLKALVVNRIVDIIQLLLSDDAARVAENVCSKSIKLLLLSLMQLTVQNYHTLHQYSVLRLHLYYIHHLRQILKQNELWDYIVLHYQSLLKQASLSLLMVESIQPNQYQYCQSHDPYRMREQSLIQKGINAILLSEYTRNFRFMIVEPTYVPINQIKLEKSYHTKFISPGWSYEPGKQVDEQATQICRIVHICNDLQLPMAIIADQECLIFAHIQEGKPRKVVVNIRYKMVEGFTAEKDNLRIKLKGAQEIIVTGQKGEMSKFKIYLIQKRDRARQRELKFIHHSLAIYYQDNLKIIAEIGEQEIQDPQHNEIEAPCLQEQQQVQQAKTEQRIVEVKQEIEVKNQTDIGLPLL